MSSDAFSVQTDKQITAMLFERWRNRPVAPLPTDPVTGKPVARPTPVRDAIKQMLTQLVAQGGSALMPLLLQLATKYLGQIAAPADTESNLIPETREALAVLATRHEFTHHAISTAQSAIPEDWAWVEEILQTALNHLGPLVIMWLMEAMSVASGNVDPSTPSPATA